MHETENSSRLEIAHDSTRASFSGTPGELNFLGRAGHKRGPRLANRAIGLGRLAACHCRLLGRHEPGHQPLAIHNQQIHPAGHAQPKLHLRNICLTRIRWETSTGIPIGLRGGGYSQKLSISLQFKIEDFWICLLPCLPIRFHYVRSYGGIIP